MIYLLAILIPPLALLFRGRPVAALINVPLTLLFWVPGIIHAVIVIADDKSKERHGELMRGLAVAHAPAPLAPQAPQAFQPSPSSGKTDPMVALLVIVICGIGLWFAYGIAKAYFTPTWAPRDTPAAPATAPAVPKGITLDSRGL